MEASEFKPKLRAVEIIPTTSNGKKVLVFKDPLGYSKELVVLPQEIAPIINLFDGTHTIRDIQLILTRQTGRLVFSEDIMKIVKLLDEHLLLDSPHFEEQKTRIQEEFRKLETRPYQFASNAYPESTSLLREWLDNNFGKRINEPPFYRAIIAPHLDIRSSINGFVEAYRHLSLNDGARVIILGTGHYLDKIIAITEKDFDTPLGKVYTDKEWIREFARACNISDYNEFYHLNEHSVEFQTIFIAYKFGNINVKIVPLLIGSFHKYIEASMSPDEDIEFVKIKDTIKDMIDENTFIVASVDFSHMGPRYGDGMLIGEKEKQLIRDYDFQLARYITEGEKEKFWKLISVSKNSYKVCGAAPIYMLMSIIEGMKPKTTGSILHYDIWEDKMGSVVSFFSIGLVPI